MIKPIACLLASWHYDNIQVAPNLCKFYIHKSNYSKG